MGGMHAGDEATTSRPRRGPLRRGWFLAAAIALLVPGLITVAALVRLWTPITADGVSAHQFGDSGAVFSVVPARGWAIQSVLGPVDYVVISAPGNRLHVTLRTEPAAARSDIVGARDRRLLSGALLETKESGHRITGTLDFGAKGVVAINAWTGLTPVKQYRADVMTLVETVEPAR